MGGTIAAVAFIAAIALGSDPKETGFGYFLTAAVVVTVAFIGYLMLPCFVSETTCVLFSCQSTLIL